MRRSARKCVRCGYKLVGTETSEGWICDSCFDNYEPERVVAWMMGKKVLAARFIHASGYGDDDTFEIDFTDGTDVTVGSFWCNDGGSGLRVDVDHESRKTLPL